MRRPAIAVGDNVSLGLLLREDLSKLWEWFNDREVRRFLQAPEEVFYFEDELEWYENLRKNKERHKVFAIVNNTSNELMGVIGLHNIDTKNGKAELGYFLWKRYWRRGYMAEAVGLALRYAFEELNLRKVYARVYEPNVGSRKVLEKNGFKLVGKLRQNVHVPGYGYVDELFYDILREEWRG
ncbi:GNAT family N-acetyltransferase [Palaeococcus ferrophilus]|uniref:GNAT family N-acetyltransferase n=1 Tax=Palaeococcus ferrophilus TaxID=83868 RepID=UPI00064FD77A|nr:GNAT family protein [Palaeococcus ferrophilus]